MAMDYFMEAAFNIAKTADFNLVRPNPLVGAVVVSNDGVIIGQGCHEQYGKAHAEVNAINRALVHKKDLSDCSLYVTLEPCSHQGKTPPCTELIKKHKIKKVVIGSSDPNPLVNGAGILRDAGVVVEEYNYPELVELNREFYINQQFKRPYVILKMAMSIDGKIADRNGNSKWLSNEQSRNHVHQELRSASDAILTTYHTVIKDNARLNIRKSDGSIQDKNVLVIDRDFKLLEPENAGLAIFESHPNSLIYLFGLQKPVKKLPGNVRVVFADFDLDGNIKLDSFLKIQLAFNHYRILVEAGSTLATQLMLHDCIDEIHLFVAPKVIGDHQAISIFSIDRKINIFNAKEFALFQVNRFESDVLLTYQKRISI